MLLVPPPARVEIDALRRACDDRSLGKIAPHLTLVPPVNVRDEHVGVALDVVRAAASSTRPFTVTLGPPAAFAPVSSTLYLSVTPEDGVRRLRDAVFDGPLRRRLTHEFVPHVTLADEIDAARLDAAVSALAGYVREVTFDRVHVMEEVDRRWAPFAEVPFGGGAVVARGGLEVRLEVTSALGPAARALLSREWPLVDGVEEREPLAVTAWRGDDVIAVADGWTAGTFGWLDGLIVAARVRGEGVGSHVLAAFESACAARSCTSLALWALDPAFYVGRGWVVAAPVGDARVLLTRRLPTG